MSNTDVIMTTYGGTDISHTVADSPVLLGFETTRNRAPEHLPIEFCDWPFTADTPDFETHLEIVAREQPRYAVAPDVEGEWTLARVIGAADQLAEHADTVIVVPKDCPPSKVPERFRIGYPNQPNWGSNGEWYINAYPPDRPVHVLGGSPESQRDVGEYLTVGSVDGAWVAKNAKFGKIWTPKGSFERPDLSYYERIGHSLGNLHAMWNPYEGDTDDNAEVPADD